MPSYFDTPDSPLWVEQLDFVSGGFIDNAELHLLSPNQAGRLLNIDPTVTGRVQKREGVQSLGGISPSSNPNGLFAFEQPLENLRSLVAVWGNKLYSTAGDGTWTARAASVSLYDTLYMATQGRGLANRATLFLSSCVGATANVSLPYGNLICLDSGWGVTEVSTIRPRATAWYQSRLWAFNLGGTAASYGGSDYLAWSAPLDGRNFDNGQTVQIDPDSGDVGVAIVPLREDVPRMLLFKEKSIHQFDIYWYSDGYYPSTANALDFTESRLRPLTLATGMVATQGGVWVPGAQGADYLFLSHEGIRSLSRSITDSQGGAGKPLSLRIQQTIDRVNWAEAHRSVAAFWNGYAYWAVPADGSVKNNLVIAYDPQRDAFFELDYPAVSWAECKLSTERKFYFFSNTACTDAILSSSTAYTNSYHVYETSYGTKDPNSQPIELDVQTRALSFDQGSTPGTGLRHRKKWNYVDLGFQAGATAATLTLQYKVDDDDAWSTLLNFYIDPQASCPYLPIQLPFSFGTGKMLRRTFLLRDIRPGFKIQFRLHDDSSFARLKVLSMTVFANPLNPKFSRT